MTFFSKFAVFSAALFLSSHAAAEEIVPAELGPLIGAFIPHDLSTVSASGESHDFESLVGEEGMVLFFVRSIDWCPFCQAQVIEADSQVEKFNGRGLSVVFLSYDPPTEQSKFMKRKNINSVMLSDQDSEIINAFGLLNENYEIGSRGYGVPHPVVFVINRDKTIAAKLYESDFLSNAKSYRHRPAVDLILEAVDEAIIGAKP